MIHIDGNKLNNAISNLKYGSATVNALSIGNNWEFISSVKEVSDGYFIRAERLFSCENG